MPRKRTRKTYPCVKSIMVPISQGDSYVDIAQILSIVNRRSYRQGMLYYVSKFEYIPSVGATAAISIDVDTVPNSWMAENAWQKSYGLWQKMNNSHSHGSTNLSKPKFYDYKVFFDATHYTAGSVVGSSANLIPVDGGGVAYATSNSEWVGSQVVISNTGGSGTPSSSEFCMHFLGGDSAAANATLGADGSKAMIQGYASTRVSQGSTGEPDLPGDASSSWMTLLFDDGETQQDVINHLESHNDEPPYATASDVQGGDNPIYPGGSESAVNGQRLTTIRTVPGAQDTSVVQTGGEVIAGLMKIGSTASDGHLIIHLAPGKYKGVAAVPIGR